MFIVFSCFGVLSCVFFCVVWFCLLVSQVIGWEDYTLMMSFVLMSFPYKDQIEELFIVMVYCIYSRHVTCQLSPYFHFFNRNIPVKGTI